MLGMGHSKAGEFGKKPWNIVYNKPLTPSLITLLWSTSVGCVAPVGTSSSSLEHSCKANYRCGDSKDILCLLYSIQFIRIAAVLRQSTCWCVMEGDGDRERKSVREEV